MTELSIKKIALSTLRYVGVIAVSIALFELIQSRNMNLQPHVEDEELPISEIIARVRDELLEAQTHRNAVGDSALFQVQDFDLDITFTVKADRQVSGGVKLLAVGQESNVASEQVHHIRLHMTTLPERQFESVADSTEIDPSGEVFSPVKRRKGGSR